MSGADSSGLDPRLQRLREDLSRHEPERSSRYEILQPLGEGATSVVYHAHDRELNRKVALKLLKEPAMGSPVRERFRREAEAAAGISHPNVVQVYDSGMDGKTPYLHMTGTGKITFDIKAGVPKKMEYKGNIAVSRGEKP